MTKSWLEYRIQALVDLDAFDNASRIADELCDRIAVAIALRRHSRFDVGYEIILPERAHKDHR